MAKKVMKKYQNGGDKAAFDKIKSAISPEGGNPKIKPAVRPGNTVKPPRSIVGPKQSPSEMRQPSAPPAVRPGNTVKTPKPYRKNKPTMQPSMRKGGSMRGKAC